MTISPWDAFIRGYADAHTVETWHGKGRVVYKKPRARTFCLGCMNSAINMDGEWKFKSECVYCSPTGFSRHVACPMFLRSPSPDYVDNPYYMYGYIRGVAAQSFTYLEVGGKI